jgi:cell division protein FtsW (lipid II flippase)
MTSETQSVHLSQSPNRIQGRLVVLAGTFLGFYALSLTLAPAARSRSWGADYRWDHWLGYLVWLILIILAHQQTKRYLPDRDPYLLPVAAMLSGWGLMTIWRLYPNFGLRQTMWYAIALIVFILGLRLPTPLKFFRKYKYVLLTGGLILTALTLIFGTNPAGAASPRLWLGCCGVYFQPSEPLKLLLIIYLSAYLADHQPWARLATSSFLEGGNQTGEGSRNQSSRVSSLPLLIPMLIMTSLALLLLLVQRDLGTATIFVFLFAVITYLATERKLILMLSAFLLVAAGTASYYLFDVVKLRIDAWLNPWLDPSGRSYQIVQSLLAMANGGVGGRGPGMGSPTLVPISHSDFIFSALIEESGLVGAIALIGLLMLLTASGLRIALRAPDGFRRLLAAGLTAYLAGQSLLIIGGNIRLLPLTGVTLPFVSYGGSSLLTAYISLLLLILISQGANTNPTGVSNSAPYSNLGAFLFASLTAAAVVVGWWTFVRGPTLLGRTDNARRAIADRYVRRGDIVDRENIPLVSTQGSTGDYSRVYYLPGLGSLVGYSHAVYGQSGLEASLDPYLRGLQGHSDLVVWWNHLLYGQPPAGVDVRLSLDINLQREANQLLGDHTGALVLLNAKSGEILALSSHPTYDPPQLEDIWQELISDEDTPLLNRVLQGQYKPGPALGPFLLGGLTAEGGISQLPDIDESVFREGEDGCAIQPAGVSWSEVIGAGCPSPQITIGRELGADAFAKLLDDLGLFTSPNLDQTGQESAISPTIPSVEEVIQGQSDIRVSPLQMALAASMLSADGVRPSPKLTAAVNLPEQGWTVFPPSGESKQVFAPENAVDIANSLADDGLPIWQAISSVEDESGQVITWYLAGTLPSWSGAPISLVILLEEDDSEAAQLIGQAMMESALHIGPD